MKKKQLPLILIGILFWGIILYLLFSSWDTILNVIFVIYAILYGLEYIVVMVIFFVVIPSYYLIGLVKERNTLRKKVRELEGKLGL